MARHVEKIFSAETALKQQVATNIAIFRRKVGLTQSQVALRCYICCSPIELFQREDEVLKSQIMSIATMISIKYLKLHQYIRARIALYYRMKYFDRVPTGRLFFRKKKKLLKRKVTHLYHIFTIFPMSTKTVIFVKENNYPEQAVQRLLDILKKQYNLHVYRISPGTGISERFRFVWRLARSKVIVLTSHPICMSGIVPRSGQTVVQAWHAGGAFKKFGLDVGAHSSQSGHPHTIWDTFTTHFLTSSTQIISVYAGAFGKPADCGLPLGALKTDALFVAKSKACALRALMEARYPRLKGKKLLLFAPTFRDEMTASKSVQDTLDLKVDFQFDPEAFERRFGNRYILGIRHHPNAPAKIPGHLASILDLTSEDEAETLACADALITDYSSLFFDFCLFERPIYFYAWDLEEYSDSRGFYQPYIDFVPGPVCFTQEELFHELENIPNRNPKAMIIWERYMSSCDGKVAERTAEYIYQKVVN